MLRRLYDWTMDKAAHRHAVWWLALFAFVEASFFPVPPHPLLGLMCLAEPKKAIRYAAVATAASVLGGLLGYAIGAVLYDTVGQQLLGLLGRGRGRRDRLHARHPDRAVHWCGRGRDLRRALRRHARDVGGRDQRRPTGRHRTRRRAVHGRQPRVDARQRRARNPRSGPRPPG